MRHPIRTIALTLFILTVVFTIYTKINVKVNQNDVVDKSKTHQVEHEMVCNMCNTNRRYLL